MATLIAEAFVPVRFTMFLEGPGADDVGRELVRDSLPEELEQKHPLDFISDTLVTTPTGEVLARLRYRASAQETFEALAQLLAEHTELAPADVEVWSWSLAGTERPGLQRLWRQLEDPQTADPGAAEVAAWVAEHAGDDDGIARALLLLGNVHYRRGEFGQARAAWRRLEDEHAAHPLRHRAHYNLLDPDNWPTPRHPDLDGHGSPGQDSWLAHVPDGARRDHVNAAFRARDDVVWTSIGLPFVRVPAGTFVMGGTPAWYERELPLRQVTISEDYWMAAWPVTRAMWAAFEPARWRGPAVEALAGELPATGVSYPDALAFCTWLAQREGFEVGLPSEAQWERASRGGIERAMYPWGDDDIEPTRCNYHRPYAVPVACYEPNGYGLFDMVGNVQEWTSDLFANDAYAHSAERVTDPMGPDSQTGELTLRAVRGGMCGSDVCKVMCRNGFRLGLSEGYRGGSIALRPVARIRL